MSSVIHSAAVYGCRIVMIKIVALLEILDPDAFREYEIKAIKVMKKYEGRLLAAFEPEGTESTSADIGEVHYIKFPTLDAYRKYKEDPTLAQLSGLRKKAISNATIFVSGKLVNYDQ